MGEMGGGSGGCLLIMVEICKGNGVTKLQTGLGEPGRAEACSTLR